MKPLSPREWQIVRLVGKALSNQAIADQLGISYNTVAEHMNRIYKKTGLRRRTALALWVISQEDDEWNNQQLQCSDPPFGGSLMNGKTRAAE